jgi:carbonic anhydrase/acetyltransferase-like protein (isoleucine patch superfamily)
LSGKRCRVHPTANVEGAVLGDRVRIGPFANVQFSTVGDLAVIGANACIEGCSIGRRAIVNAGVQLRGSICGDEASIGTEFNQMSVVGHRSVVCPGVALLDFSLRGSVAVTIDGQSVRTGSMILGGAIGHDVFAGPGVSLVAGASVPSGWALVKSPREMIRGSDPPQVPEALRRMDRYGIRRAA